MKNRTKIKSKLSIAFSEKFPKAYNDFTLKHVNQQKGMPETILSKPLAECKVALLSTAGVHLKTDIPFNLDLYPGDHTVRIVPGDAREEDLTVTHMYYDTKSAKKIQQLSFLFASLRSWNSQEIQALDRMCISACIAGTMETGKVEGDWIQKGGKCFKKKRLKGAF